MCMNKNKVIYGDILDVFASISNEEVDLICTDLPFGKTKDPLDKIIPPDKLWPDIWRITKKNAAILFFGENKFSAMMMLSTPFHRYNIIYEKTTVTGYLNSGVMPLRCHEDMMVFYRKKPTYNPQKTTGHPRKISTDKHKKNSKKTVIYGNHKKTSYNSTERYPRSVWKFKTDKQKSGLHPNQKPVKLIEQVILTYSNPGDTVLDFCSGSGTTGEACINTGRNFILVEKDKDRFNDGLDRIKSIYKQKKYNTKTLEIICNNGLQNQTLRALY